MTTATSPAFSGPYQEALTNLADVVEKVWADHDTSFVKAGDDKVYALGGAGYVVVMDERKWEGLVEILTPDATISTRPGEGGTIAVTAPNLEESDIKKHLKATADHLIEYYQKRYPFGRDQGIGIQN
jgi:hypothetical protein